MSRNASSKAAAPAEPDKCCSCWEDIEYYSLGPCNHRMFCHVCTVRLRSLCEMRQCPMCRAECEPVILTREKTKAYADLRTEYTLTDTKLGILFQDATIQREVNRLFEFRCTVCDAAPEKGMKELRDHMKKMHGLHHCELCLKHLKVFVHEHRTYDRKDLVRHSKSGDPDNSSFRGHPLCEFCDKRFFDNDELLIHLRRQHFTCFLCERRDVRDRYYQEYNDLEEHFRAEHYLCEDPACLEKKFIAFDCEIDIKAHDAEEHMQSWKMSRSKAKQARVIPTNFGVNRGDDGPSGGNSASRGGRRYQQFSGPHNQGPNPQHMLSTQQQSASSARPAQAPPPTRPIQQPPPPAPRQPSPPAVPQAEEFPTLGGGPAPAPTTMAQSAARAPAATPQEDFPVLGSAAANKKAAQQPTPTPLAGIVRASGPGRSAAVTVTTASATAARPQQSQPTAAAPAPSAASSSATSSANAAPAFVQPPNFQERNQELIKQLKTTLGERFSTFKSISAMFRRDEISPLSYYTQFYELLGPAAGKIFPELVALLPDPPKQQQLLAIHKQHSPTAASIASGANVSLEAGATNKVLIVNSMRRGQGRHAEPVPKGQALQQNAWRAEQWTTCAVCGQVVLAKDATAHAAQHGMSYASQNDFPVLSSGDVRGPYSRRW